MSGWLPGDPVQFEHLTTPKRDPFWVRGTLVTTFERAGQQLALVLLDPRFQGNMIPFSSTVALLHFTIHDVVVHTENLQRIEPAFCGSAVPHAIHGWSTTIGGKWFKCQGLAPIPEDL